MFDMPIKKRHWGEIVKRPLWQPSPEAIARSRVMAFISFLEETRGLSLEDWQGLSLWSVRKFEDFWEAAWDFFQVKAAEKGQIILQPAAQMYKARFFPQARLNYAENLLRRRSAEVAVIARNEKGSLPSLSFEQLYERVSQCVQYFLELGVKKGDCLVAMMPNIPETLIAMLAAAALGCVWASCSPDFGVSGVLDRFGQIGPKLFICVDGYTYGGKDFSIIDKVQAIREGIPSLLHTIVVPYLESSLPAFLDSKGITNWNHSLEKYRPQEISFEPMAFDDPLFIMFTSGTTGMPKCIVHGVGGTLLQHMKEHQLHCDVKPLDRVFYYTTCGWMMWNWQMSALASEATLVLYDGSPMFPEVDSLFDYAEEEKVTLFGVSAKYIDALKKAEAVPAKTYPLESLRLITSTGSPLVDESFDYVYSSIKSDVCLASISGGTDIISCFVLGSAVLPVWRGEIQTRGLGLSVEVFDENGKSVKGKKGELVCSQPFPCMPVYFWNDPEDAKYREAYFSKYPNVWCHGDLMEMTEDGGFIIYGRSDTVLNPGGVRIGTSEIYRQVDQCHEVLESLVVGQDWDNDVRIVLFVKLKPGFVLNDMLVQHIKKQIRLNASPRHMPAKIIQVTDIPRTKSGKLVELAVRNIIHGRPVVNQEALANPESLKLFENLPELQN